VSAEDAKHYGADKRKRDIRGHDTQPADGHGKLLSFTSLPASNPQFTKRFRAEKVSVAVRAPRNGNLTWLKTREINILKSP
jgi:hypothetical protein